MFAKQKLILGILALCTSVIAEAASVSVYLDQSNRAQVFSGGENYLKVTISDGESGNINFLVETLQELQDKSVSDNKWFGLQAFSFNFGTSGARLGNIVIPDDWRFGGYRKNPVGIFDATLKTNKFNRTDPLIFSITGVDGDTPQDYLASLSLGSSKLGNFGFMARVGGLDIHRRSHCMNEANEDAICKNAFGKSAKFYGSGLEVVPLPAAAWLFFSAFLTLLGQAKRTACRDSN